MKQRSLVAIGAGLAVALAFAGGWWLGGRTDPGGEKDNAPGDPATAGTQPEAEPEVLYWYDPMYPDRHFDAPGPSPFMDMQLVPRYADAAGDAATVRIDPGTVQNLGVRTAIVERGVLAADISVPGTIAWDLRREHVVSARTTGVLERLHVRAPFEPVRSGQALATVRAPEWSAAMAEYRALRDADSSDARALREAARARLRALGMEEAQVRALERDGSDAASVLLRSPVDGVVSAIDAREGQQLLAGAPVMTVNGLDTVWVQAAVPQAQAAAVRGGTPVRATVDALPGREFEGRVEALLPAVEAGTRTQTARIVLDNPGHVLAPGMFARVHIAGTAGEEWPLVPDEALVATGEDARVIVAEGEGRFRPVRVRTGQSAGGMTELLSGLEGGERIVVSGQFLLDSEASLSGVLGRLGGQEREGASAPHEGHEGHDGHESQESQESQESHESHEGHHP